MSEWLLRQKDQITIELCRRSFWHFCKTLAPDFYTDDKTYLKELCDTLQSFVLKQIINPLTKTHYLRLIIEMPPRHGKTRTLVLLCAWMLGNNTDNKIITSAYNDDFATDFSRYTRDTIKEEKNIESQIVFSDIFQDTKIKYGDASFKQWALEGHFFNFKSAGKGGSVTGKGGNLLLIDDPVKSAEDAYNKNQLRKDWLWYSGTWISRKEKAVEIINHTPWAKDDIGGRLQEEFADTCLLFKRPACVDGKMLCDDILSLDEYKDLEKTMDEVIFEANYNLNRIDVKGLLYGTDWKTYTEFPKDENGKELVSSVKMWCDTADKGSDYLCAIFGRQYKGYTYVIDVYYTKDSVETTEPELAYKTIDNKTSHSRYESNGGGHAIGHHVKKILEEKYKWFGTVFDFPNQGKNKESRINSNARMVKEKIIFPIDWKIRFPEFYKAVTTYMKEGKNKNDDAPDTLTQIVECDIIGGGNYFIKRRR